MLQSRDEHIGSNNHTVTRDNTVQQTHGIKHTVVVCHCKELLEKGYLRASSWVSLTFFFYFCDERVVCLVTGS